MIAELVIRDDDGKVLAGPFFFDAIQPYLYRTPAEAPLVSRPKGADPQDPKKYYLYAAHYTPTVVLKM